MMTNPPEGHPTKLKGEPTANGVPASVPIENPAAARRGCCRSRDQVLRCLRANLLVLLTVVAVVAGVAVGLGVSKAGGAVALGPSRLAAFAFPGELLLRLLRMIILPLVVCSLIGGAASLDPKALGRLGAWALLFFLVTTLIASAVGVSLALALQPGAVLATNSSAGDTDCHWEEEDVRVPRVRAASWPVQIPALPLPSQASCFKFLCFRFLFLVIAGSLVPPIVGPNRKWLCFGRSQV